MRKICIVLLSLLLLTGCSTWRTAITETTVSVTEAAMPETTVAETSLPVTVPAEAETVPAIPPEPESEDTFVRVLDYIPTATQELMYATENNFTGVVIYDFEDAYLRWGTAKKLKQVSEDLAELGLYLKIWDGFRPVSAQFVLWEVCPNPTYVADPNKGHSSHSRGNTNSRTGLLIRYAVR